MVEKDLEDHTKNTFTHHNLIVKYNNKEYQVNIDIQSDAYPNVKVYFNDAFNHPLLENIGKLTDEGLFNLNELSQDYKLDYLRSNVV
ncbi:DUF2278 family protein [Candidatus Cardinium sp. TP]|nr:DUF2278 family protein [Candidatus Cardinium sp. TP]